MQNENESSQNVYSLAESISECNNSIDLVSKMNDKVEEQIAEEKALHKNRIEIIEKSKAKREQIMNQTKKENHISKPKRNRNKRQASKKEQNFKIFTLKDGKIGEVQKSSLADKIKVENNYSKNINKPLNYYCAICTEKDSPKAFPQKSNLTRHIIARHSSNGNADKVISDYISSANNIRSSIIRDIESGKTSHRKNIEKAELIYKTAQEKMSKVQGNSEKATHGIKKVEVTKIVDAINTKVSTHIDKFSSLDSANGNLKCTLCNEVVTCAKNVDSRTSFLRHLSKSQKIEHETYRVCFKNFKKDYICICTELEEKIQPALSGSNVQNGV